MFLAVVSEHTLPFPSVQLPTGSQQVPKKNYLFSVNYAINGVLHALLLFNFRSLFYVPLFHCSL